MSASLLDVTGEQRFTQPPPRYTEASLVRALEEKGIGRPSTYAPTISTIITRGYVARENKRLIPTELGKIVNDLMCKNFPDIVNIQFTAGMEEKLDEVEEGRRGLARRSCASSTGPSKRTLEKAEGSASKRSPSRTGGVRYPLRKVRGDDGLQDEHATASSSPAPTSPPAATRWRCPSSIGVACPQCGAQAAGAHQPQGAQVLRLRALSGVRVRLLGPARFERKVPRVRLDAWCYKRGRKGDVYHVCVNENCRHRVEVDRGGGNDADE